MITITTVSSTCSVIPPQTQLQLHNFPLRTSISTTFFLSTTPNHFKHHSVKVLCPYTRTTPPTLLYQASSAFPQPPFEWERPAPKRPVRMIQSPMLSCPLKQTNEIDWIQPLKDYIRQSYGEDPERYHAECATLNRLRQDMRGAGKDSATGRDLLYRYYGQLELLDLRFPVDENHIKISFSWYGWLLL